jgi:hypothetical protein
LTHLVLSATWGGCALALKAIKMLSAALIECTRAAEYTGKDNSKVGRTIDKAVYALNATRGWKEWNCCSALAVATIADRQKRDTKSKSGKCLAILAVVCFAFSSKTSTPAAG